MLEKVTKRRRKLDWAKWANEVNRKFNRVFHRLSNIEECCVGHNDWLVDTDKKLRDTEQEVNDLKELNRTLTEKIIKLDDRLSLLEERVSNLEIFRNMHVLVEKNQELLEENARLRSELHDIYDEEGYEPEGPYGTPDEDYDE